MQEILSGCFSYLPHFLSWVVIAGIWMSFLAPSDEGGLNQILSIFGLGSSGFYYKQKGDSLDFNVM